MKRRTPLAVLVVVSCLLSGGVLVAGSRASGRLRVDRDIVYATPDGHRLGLDVFRSGAPEAAPVVVVIHGGSWKGGDKSNWDQLAPEIARAGYVVFSIDYRLTGPGVTYPAPNRDVTAAIDWVAANASRFGGDAGRLAVIGSSAGGHLALLEAARRSDGVIDAVAALSPPADLTALMDTSLASAVERYLGCAPAACPRRAAAASPTEIVHEDMPPVFLAYSTDELIPRPQLDTLATRLEASGVEIDTAIFEGTRHALLIGPDALDETLAFISKRV